MISRRLTKTQKSEIVEAYRAGLNTIDLAEKYSCSSNTINRTVKNILSETEYKSLKEKRLKSINKKEEAINNGIIEEKIQDLENKTSLISSQEKVIQISQYSKVDNDFYNPKIEEIEYSSNENVDNFEEIAPLESSFDFEKEKQKPSLEVLNKESLPESVYMLVDKKVELDSQPISDLPEWSFLPETELKRHAIILFSNQRTAKRNCSRNQRVIKVPNTNVFIISKSYLVSKGITRLILEDSIISLDS
tara:strand:+ start:364 stop:1107 length:744 start_codon:yes stop_codon:yes gene_type:complete